MSLCEELEKAFPRLERFFTEDNLLKFKSTKLEDLDQYNKYGLGTLIRHDLLKITSPLKQAFRRVNITDKFEMSDYLIRSYYMHINGIMSPSSHHKLHDE